MTQKKTRNINNKYQMFNYIDLIFKLINNPIELGYRLTSLLAGWLVWPHLMEWSQKICNMSLSRKIFGHCHLVQNFPPGSRDGLKIENSIRPFSFGLRDFFFFKWSWKLRNFSLWRKQFEHCPEYLPGSRDVIKNSIRPFSIWLEHLFSSNCLRKYTI